MNRYSVDVSGIGSESFEAETASKARWQAFKAVREAGYRLTFREFLSQVYTMRLGAT